ncbi:hypothetical protein SAY86_001227 [Trapa natans]|uniref:3,4-dihydroxy-2-butanone-4-phosphate synthase n=1 Tax=Trapa natans TaxID=22666 RepID=A0AAN7MD96_TRANT|nr:hypothetical protein SAY86_001227 [Trapa natans]
MASINVSWHSSANLSLLRTSGNSRLFDRSLRLNPMCDGFLPVLSRIHSGTSLSFRIRRNQKTSTDVVSGNGVTLPLIDGFPIRDDDDFDLDSPTESFYSIQEAIENIGQGKLVLVVDDEDRENEGDLIMAAEKATPEAMAFIVKYGSGIICV